MDWRRRLMMADVSRDQRIVIGQKHCDFSHCSNILSGERTIRLAPRLTSKMTSCKHTSPSTYAWSNLSIRSIWIAKPFHRTITTPLTPPPSSIDQSQQQQQATPKKSTTSKNNRIANDPPDLEYGWFLANDDDSYQSLTINDATVSSSGTLLCQISTAENTKGWINLINEDDDSTRAGMLGCPLFPRRIVVGKRAR